MEKIYKESIGLWQLRTDKSHILHRIGSDDYTENRDAHVRNPDEWFSDDLKKLYDAEVERLIAERYSHGKEIEVNREKEEKPERFAEYLAYVEQCKLAAKTSLAAKRERETINSENYESTE